MGASFKAKDGTTLDNLFKDIERKIMPVKKGYLKVGIISDPQGGIDANTVKTTRDSKGQEKPDPQGINIVQVAAIHEYGSEKQNIPQRSFLRSTFEEQQKNIPQIFAKLMKAQLRSSGKIDEEEVFNKIGAYMTSKVREKFRNNDWEPLKGQKLNLSQTRKKSVKKKASIKSRIKKLQRKLVKRIKGKAKAKISQGESVGKKKLAKKKINRRPLIDTGQLRRSTGWAWVQDES